MTALLCIFDLTFDSNSDDGLDLSCDEVWENGTEVATPFDGLISFSDASELWGLSESTLRKAVAYGKIVPGVDARKYGK